MIKRIKRNVPYNKPLIVASIIADKLGDNPETAVVTPVISIGFNGTEFVSRFQSNKCRTLRFKIE